MHSHVPMVCDRHVERDAKLIRMAHLPYKDTPGCMSGEAGDMHLCDVYFSQQSQRTPFSVTHHAMLEQAEI
jgi:hypothetical protein